MNINITPSTILIAFFITILFIVAHQIYLTYRKLTPYKKDRLANDAFFYIYMIHRDYFNLFQFLYKSNPNHNDFDLKLWRIGQIFQLEAMQDEFYRNQFRFILHKNYSSLQEAYILFEQLRHMPIIHEKQVIMVMERIHQIINTLIVDLEEQSYKHKKPSVYSKSS